tara:strand:+ start:274 stop:828 length:555 start_codon:yes stop_codon:yes gene_type:complete
MMPIRNTDAAYIPLLFGIKRAVNDIISTDDVSEITLQDGTVLDTRQAMALQLRATTGLHIDDIAAQSGYSSRSTCSAFLRSDRGRQGLQVAIRQHLLDGARVGLQAMVKLATSAKSENVRQLAAADLLDRAGYKASEVSAPVTTGNRDVNISINLASSNDLQQMIEVKEGEVGGSGEKAQAHSL